MANGTILSNLKDADRLICGRPLSSILGSLRGCTIGILGLAFKPNTDDMREAPSVDLIRWITSQGAMVQVYDPVASKTAQEALSTKAFAWMPLLSVRTPTRWQKMPMHWSS